MKPVYDAIYDIINQYFSDTSTYSSLLINPSKQFIYGTNFPERIAQPLQTVAIESKIGNITPKNINDSTYIFYQPLQKTFYQQTSTIDTIEVVVENKTYTQDRHQNYNKYYETFNLIFWTKSVKNTNTREAFLFSEIFFNIFRGNVDIRTFLFNYKIFDFTFNNFTVQDLSYIENINGVSRYQASFSAKYEIMTNINIVDNLHNIIIDNNKVF